ncbi:MAG: magnesium transporter [Acidimicrobiia bacterium]|nr:magnesium transporter [Acidimicrobiia bacterium]
MRRRLLRPRELARQLRLRARREPGEVEEYLEGHGADWAAIAEATPGDAADILEAISEAAAGELVTELSVDDAAEVLEELRDDLAAEILLELDPARASEILTEMPPEEAVDILEQLERDEINSLLELVDDEAADEIRDLLTFAPDSAGGLMTTDIAALPIGMTSGEAIERLRQLHEEVEDLSYVYIIDDDERLVGVLSFRDLVFNRPGVGLGDAMVRNPITVQPDTDREVVAELTQRYNLFGIPVVSSQGRLLGMVTHESVIETVQAEASEDFATSVGAGAEETVYTDVARSVRVRLPWLGLNLLLALTVAFVIESQTGLISREPVLAALMPVIALIGGNGGAQSLAVVIRGLATDSIPSGRSREIVGRQAAIGLFNGLALAVFAALVTVTLLGLGIFGTSQASSVEIATVVAIAALANLLIASTAGTLIPLGMRRIGLDPALASSIFLTLITDIVGFGGFLGVAGLLL